ncbi:MAG: hypothetical protein HQ472_07840 [Ignavibacteria bacterium]|nr:hypothetical protein [Ignavibacteria bacterium]
MNKKFSAFLILSILVCFVSPNSTAQILFIKSDGDTLVRRGIELIYNVKFDSAHQMFESVKKMYPKHPAGYFMDAMVDWWRVSFDRSTRSYDQVFLNKIQKVLTVCEKAIEEDPSDIVALFFKGGALGFRGRYYALREDWLSAADDGATALPILQECQKIAPSNRDIMIGTGIYNYFAAMMPEKYPLLKPVMMFLPSGDKKIGILQLRAAAKSAKYAAVEAKAVLVQLYYDFENSPSEAIVYARDLANSYPNNPYFQRAFGRCLVQLGPLDTMEILWRNVTLACLDKKAGYDRHAAREALYYVGLSRMLHSDYDLALRYFYKCDEASRILDQDPSGFMVKLNLKIGQIYDILDKRSLAVAQYQKVLAWRDYSGSIAEAQKYLSEPYKR